MFRRSSRRSSARRYKRKSPSRRKRLLYEFLEPRRLLAIVNWTGLGDGTTFHDPNNWGAGVPGASDDAIIELLAGAWSQRADRGAEQRATMPGRGSFVPVEALRANPHLEMHTRGG